MKDTTNTKNYLGIVMAVMIVLLALIVGTIVVALFLPLITIIQDLTAGG